VQEHYFNTLGHSNWNLIFLCATFNGYAIGVCCSCWSSTCRSNCAPH